MNPIFIEDSAIPIILSCFSPIEIYAITLFPFVIARGKIGDRTRNHETIHFQQYLETLVIGFLIIYAYDFVKGYFKYGSGDKSYMKLRAEQEAYEYANDFGYIASRRKRWEWLTKYEV